MDPLFFAIFASALAPGSATVPTPSDSASSQTTAEIKVVAVQDKVKEKKKCRAIQQTGTRIGATKLCRTTTEWAEIDRLTAEQNKAFTGGVDRTRTTINRDPELRQIRRQ